MKNHNEKDSQNNNQNIIWKTVTPELREMSIANLAISNRIKRALFVYGINNIGEVLQLKNNDIICIPSLGKAAEKEILKQKTLLIKNGDKYFNQKKRVKILSSDILELSVNKLSVYSRIHKALFAYGVTNIGQLLRLKYDEISNIPSIGKVLENQLKEHIISILLKGDRYFYADSKQQTLSKSLPTEILEMSINNFHIPNSLKTKLFDNGIETIDQIIEEQKNNFRKTRFYLSHWSREKIEKELLLLFEKENSYFISLEDQGQIEKDYNYFIPECSNKTLSADILKMPVNNLHISERIKQRLFRYDIITIEDLLQLTEDDLSSMPVLGKKSKKELHDQLLLLMEKEEKYFFNSNEEQGLKNRNLDVETFINLRDNYGLKLALVCKWFGISKQSLSQKINKINNGHWRGKKILSEECDIVNEMISDNSFHYVSEEVECYLLNNMTDDTAIVFVYKDDIKCFYLKELPQEIQRKILDNNLQKFSEIEVNVIQILGKFVTVLGEKNFNQNLRIQFCSVNSQIKEK